MEEFFRSVEQQAFRMALFACQNREDALDLVQDAMCGFVDSYAGKERSAWKALFYRMLQNRIRDYYRKQRVRSRWRGWLGQNATDDHEDPLEKVADPANGDPERQTRTNQAFGRLQEELGALTLKQQQIFLLRAWEGLSIRETAQAMGCTEGTVKTHYYRATERLKERLGEYWP